MTQRDQPLISVIMPCYNAERFVADAVGSVLTQESVQVELVVVDDGSTDRSCEILAALEVGNPGRMRVFHQPNRGPYPARNLGLSHAHGKFVAFLDADDYWHPQCLGKLHATLEQSGAALAYCGWQNIGVEGGRGAPYVPPDYEAGDKAEAFLRSAAPWPIHAALVRREIITAVGGFDTHWQSCMDYDLWLRIAVAKPIALVPEVMAFYRHHGSGQITSRQWVQAENTLLVKRKFLASHPELVAHLTANRLKELTDGVFLKRGYQSYWQRDLVSARRIFRKALHNGGWGLADLRYLLPALLPEKAYLRLIRFKDSNK